MRVKLTNSGRLSDMERHYQVLKETQWVHAS